MKISSLTASLPATVPAVTVVPAMAQNAVVVNGEAIPSAEVGALIKRSGQPESPELCARARDMLVDRRLTEQDTARHSPLECDNIQKQLAAMYLNVFVAAGFGDYVKNSSTTENELYKQYNKIKTWFGNSKEYHTHHILVGREDDTKAIIAKLKVGTKLGDITEVRSKDKGSGVNGDDLGQTSLGTYVPELSAVFTGLRKGQITQTPVKTRFGRYVIRLDNTRDARIPLYEDVKPQLLKMMMGDQNWQRSKFQAMLKDLCEEAKIQ